MTKLNQFYLTLLFIVCSFNFVRSSNCTNTTYISSSEIQIVRIDFTMPNGYIRHLALGFTTDNIATDGYDYGYDALNHDSFPYDLNWMIEDERYVIQGVGAFDDTKKYPLGLFMSNDGDIEISLDTLENFDTPIDLFIYDALLKSYTQINESNFAASINKGDYIDRFYLAFKSTSSDSSAFAKTSLSTEDFSLENIKVNYLYNTKELYINTNDKFTIKSIYVSNLLGQNMFSINQVNSKLIKIPFQTNQSKYGIITLETEEGQRLSKQIVIN